MKINYKKTINEKAEVGDLIKFEDGAIGIFVKDQGIFLLKDLKENNKFKLAYNIFLSELCRGSYKIIAKANEWEINVLR